jgi:predicted acyltransferase
MKTTGGRKSRRPLQPTAGGRVESIDALRGFDMFWIAGGQGLFVWFLLLFTDKLPPWLEYQLDHHWGGFTAWDLIMPLFLFICGTSMPFSLGRRIETGESRASIWMKILRRVLVLFVLGMAVQGNLLEFKLSSLHIYCNTLQAIAAGYLIAGAVFLYAGVAYRIAAVAALLAGYWALMALVPFPGHPAGTLLPDANLALHIDEAVLSRFRDGTPYTWILSSMGFGATVLMGALGGQLLKSRRSARTKVLGLLAAGAGCMILGWAWSFRFPFIKHLWTSSMALWSGGLSYLLLGIFYLVIDVWGFRSWAFPFVVIGANAIFAYASPVILDWSGAGNNLAGGLAGHVGRYGDFLKSAAGFMILWTVLYYLYRKRTFLRI